MKLIAGRYRPVETLGFGGMCGSATTANTVTATGVAHRTS